MHLLLLALLTGCAEPERMIGQAPPPVIVTSLFGPREVTTGGPLEVSTFGFPVGAQVRYAASANLTGPPLCPALFAPFCTDLAAPLIRLGTATTGPAGDSRLVVTVPSQAPAEVIVQALASHNGTSNLSPALRVRILPRDGDVDGDGLTNFDEIYDYFSRTDLADTDGDGLDDALEARLGLVLQSRDSDLDGVPDPLEDTDGDTLNVQLELDMGLDPGDPDTDGDGVRDDEEDTDGDGLPDYFELINPFGTSDPFDADTDDDGLDDNFELIQGTQPRSNDTDGDGVLDGDEDRDGDGLLARVEASFGVSDLATDSDGDLLSDADEIFRFLTDPAVRDTDGDGQIDGLEDIDGDTLEEFNEFRFGCDPFNPDTDGDGLLDRPEELGLGTACERADSDGGGTPDGVEVSRGTNPLSAADD
jgi:hypothetical protein